MTPRSALEDAARRHPITADPELVRIADAGLIGRLGIRGAPALIAGALGEIGLLRYAEVMDGRARAMRLGPDEWLLLCEPAACRRLHGELSEAFGRQHHALVALGDRMAAVDIEGPCAVSVLACGCPLDLHLKVAPVGFASRTVLGKAEIILHRRAAHRFTLHTNRSFATYVWLLLREAAREHVLKGGQSPR